ncbi:MAG: hypothetical protein ACJ72N_08560, partial [Labedaea sp.]
MPEQGDERTDAVHWPDVDGDEPGEQETRQLPVPGPPSRAHRPPEPPRPPVSPPAADDTRVIQRPAWPAPQSPAPQSPAPQSSGPRSSEPPRAAPVRIGPP